jgi:hypothetical protein
MANDLYHKQKMDFLDNLQPDDFRNPSNFNQAETIIDNINKAYYKSIINKSNAQDFIEKAVNNLFRENSAIAKKAIKLSTLIDRDFDS